MIVHGLLREQHVPIVQRDRSAVRGDGRCVDRRVERERDDQRRDEHDEERGQEPPRAPRVERREVDVAGGERLAREQPGDEVAGQHEEDVDANEAAGQRRNAGVERDHEQDREPTQAFDVTSETRGALIHDGENVRQKAGRSYRVAVGDGRGPPPPPPPTAHPPPRYLASTINTWRQCVPPSARSAAWLSPAALTRSV